MGRMKAGEGYEYPKDLVKVFDGRGFCRGDESGDRGEQFGPKGG
jgi:hypothetical protein